MNKELEALENYLFNEWKQNHVNFGCDYKLEAELEKQLNNLKSVKQALQRLDNIDNANPNEALKKFKENTEMFDEIAKENDHTYKENTVIEAYVYHANNIDIEQALLKAQEQEKVLSIIKETKNIKVSFYENGSGKHYKLEFDRTKNQTITEEEFDLLKRWLG